MYKKITISKTLDNKTKKQLEKRERDKKFQKICIENRKLKRGDV